MARIAFLCKMRAQELHDFMISSEIKRIGNFKKYINPEVKFFWGQQVLNCGYLNMLLIKAHINNPPAYDDIESWIILQWV